MDKKDLIFQTFTYNKRLRFSKLEKLTKLRSNELAYFLKQMIGKNVLKKDGEEYILTTEGEKQIPYFHEHNKLTPLPTVLVRIINEESKVLMIKRNKRPYQNLWSLPGGRIILGETIKDAAIRIVKIKTFLDIEVNSQSLIAGNEYVLKDDIVQHGFILLVISAKPVSIIKEKENIKWFDTKEIKKEETIESDFYYATTDKPIQGKEFIIKDEE